MSRPDSRKRIHSFAEVYLSIRVAACAKCGRGPITPDRTNLRLNADDGTFTIMIACGACAAKWDVCYDTRKMPPAGFAPLLTVDLPLRQRLGELPQISATDEPSELIDVPGWVTLHNMLVDRARETAESAHSVGGRVLARQMQMQAGECLDEALKFFEEDDQLPPPAAFFTDAALSQFRHSPELFTRDRLLEMRNKLPVQRA
jgi:hypothetical protein